MQLRVWLAKERMGFAEFARISGIGSRQLVHGYAHGKLFPGRKNLIRIKETTRGEVTAEDLLFSSKAA